MGNEPIQWEAFYKDGSSLSQFEGDVINRYGDIDLSKIVKFVLHKDEKVFMVLHLDANKRLIFRKRIAMKVISGKKQIVYIVGWQEKINGKNVQSLSFIFDDGHIEMVDKFRDDTAWFYSINFRPEEMV